MLLASTPYRKAEVEQEPHNLFVDFSEDNLFSGPDKSFTSVNCGLPYPGKPVLPVPDNFKDPIKEILKERSKYEDLLKDARQSKLLQKVEDKSLGDSNYKYMPRRLLQLYQIQEPDQYFGIKQNGVLDIVKVDLVWYFVWPIFDGTLKLMNIDTQGEDYKFTINSNLKSISVNTYSFDNEAYILLQDQFSVTVFKICHLPDGVTAFNLFFDKRILDMKLNAKNKKLLGLIFDDNQFCIQNIHTQKNIFKYNSKSVSNNIVQFEFYEESKVLLMHQFSLEIFDYISQNILQTFDPKLMMCNELCSFMTLGDTLILISRHYVIRTDLKTMKDFKTFSHTLSYPPHLVDTVLYDGDYYLCLGSHLEDDKILFSGNVLFGLPCKVPGIKTTLNEAVLQNPQLIIKENLYKRIDFLTVGFKFLVKNNSLYLYSVNSVGDIFRQVISYKSLDNTRAINQFCDWALKLQEPTMPLHITHFVQMGDAFLNLQKPLKKTKGKSIVHKQENNLARFIQHFQSIYSKENMKSTFGQGFLDIWEDSDSSPEDELFSNDEETKDLLYEKVNNWMKGNDAELEEK
ncbi:uncharacterized protein [Euwallacea fornicatus]|uniref:uncharacterized protein n=1 Tax=Euwallacea fornicatus TaxID=995702 RepID=UPI00338E80E5